MKQGRSLQELAIEIRRQQDAKQDYLADISQMSMANDGTIEVDGLGNSFRVNEIAHVQIGQYLEIPSKYYEKMRYESPSLLADNVNHWLHKPTIQPERRMLRTMDGKLRAFLSDRYRIIDNMAVAETVLPVISQMDGASVVSCEITDEKMYIKVVNRRIETEIKVGDVVQSGIVISNSEVGLGSVNVSPLIYRLVCSNGMIAQDGRVRKNHVGRTNDMGFDFSIFRDETLEADDRAFLMKVRDAVTAAADQAVFDRIVEQMRDATFSKIDPITVPKVTELTSKQFGISINETEGVLGHLINGGDLSLYGMANAVTRYAQDVKSYDRSTELESTGYRILTMSPKLWNSILSTARKEV